VSVERGANGIPLFGAQSLEIGETANGFDARWPRTPASAKTGARGAPAAVPAPLSLIAAAGEIEGKGM